MAENKFSPGVLDRIRSAAARGGGADSIVQVPLDQIERDEAQPRHNMQDIKGLAESIRRAGRVLQPITLTRLGPNRYRIRFGERRWLAAGVAGLATVPAIIEDKDSDPGLRKIEQVIENQHSRHLTNSELAEAIEFMTEGGESNEAISDISGVPAQHLKMYRAVSKLPDVLATWVDRLDMRTVYELYLSWRRVGEKEREGIVERLASIEKDDGLSLTEARRFIRSLEGESDNAKVVTEGEGRGVPEGENSANSQTRERSSNDVAVETVEVRPEMSAEKPSRRLRHHQQQTKGDLGTLLAALMRALALLERLGAPAHEVEDLRATADQYAINGNEDNDDSAEPA